MRKSPVLLLSFICLLAHAVRLPIHLPHRPLPHREAQVFTLPRFCKTSRCIKRALNLLESACDDVRLDAGIIHASCVPSIIPSLISTRRFAKVADSPTLRLLSRTFHNITRLPHPPAPPPDRRVCPSNGGAGVTVYVIDTGCRSAHNQLSGRVWTFPAEGSAYKSGEDDHGHGTHVAATIAGRDIGLAPHADIVCIKALSHANEGSGRDVMSGIEQVLRMHRPGSRGVISISLGVRATRTYKAIDRAVGRAAKAGLVTVVAAGNSGRDACTFTPARAKAAVTVAAVGQDGLLAEFSNWGSCVDVGAPGVRVWSAVARGNDWYGVSSGTSMAAPFVSGLVALRLGEGGEGSVEDVRKWLWGISEEIFGLRVVSVEGFCRWKRKR